METSDKLKSVMDNTKEKLRQIKGQVTLTYSGGQINMSMMTVLQVFHMMDGKNQLVRLRVGTDGKISLERRILSIPNINLGSIVSVPKRVLEAGMGAREKMMEVRREAQGR